jgi:hypothetical protein
MIIYRKQPFDFKMKNIIVLDAGLTDGYIYVNKETYEQAVALGITFSKDHERIEKALGKSIDGWKITPGIYTAFRKASEALPSPINMLSTFIGLATDAGIDWHLEGEELCETVCGVLHTISQFADFYSMTLVPADQRTKLEIPKHVYKGYKESWKDIIDELDSKVLCVNPDELSNVVEESIRKNVGDIISEKVKEIGGSANTSTSATVDPAQIRDMVDKMVSEKINVFMNTELPKLIQQHTQNINPMMNAFNPYQQPMYQNPYQQPMYQQPVQQQPILNVAPAPIPVPQQAPIPVPQAVPQPAPVQQVAPQPTQPTPAPQPVQSAPVETVQQPQADTKASFLGGEVEIVEGENVVDPNEILAIFNAVDAKHDDKLKKEKEKLSVEEKAPKKEEKSEPLILTEDVRKEKDIALESIKIINSYDI